MEKQNNNSITRKEAVVLLAICNSDYHDGECVIDNPVWLIDYNDVQKHFTSPKEVSGVWSQLNQKKLAYSQPESQPGENDAECKITQKGWDALKEYGIELIPNISIKRWQFISNETPKQESIKKSHTEKVLDCLNSLLLLEIQDLVEHQKKFQQIRGSNVTPEKDNVDGYEFDPFDMKHFLEWNAQSLFITSHRIYLLRAIKKQIEVKGIANGLSFIKDHLTKKVLEQPYRHCSTSLMANALKEWEISVETNIIKEIESLQ
jgi:hypothetical protein